MSQLPVLVTALLLVLLAFAGQIFYTALLTPLAKIPNAHWTVPWSKLWLLNLRWTGQEHRTRYQLHKDLGPVIRIGPEELSVNCLEDGVHTIYGNFDKSPWFGGFVFYGQPFMFTMLPSGVHMERKRMMSAVYSKSYIQHSSSLAHSLRELLLKRVMPRIETWASEAATVDVHRENQAFSLDMTAAYLFGLDNACNLIEQIEQRDVIVPAFTQSLGGIFWHEFPLLRRTLSWFGLDPVPKSVPVYIRIIEDFCSSMCKRVKLQAEANTSAGEKEKKKKAGSDAVVYTHLYERLKAAVEPHEPLDDLMAAEMLDHLIAGNDGNANTLTFFLWEIACHPALQERLRAELLALPSDGGGLPNAQQLDQAPTLDAALTETFRLHPAGLGPHLRVVPPGGTKLGSFTNVPAGTTVSATAWAMHRNEDVFPEPEAWLPERWLTSQNDKEMLKWFFAFGAGGRKCIGNNLGIRAIKTYIAAVLCRFQICPTDRAGLEITDAHMGRPAGNELFLKFRKL